MEFKERLRKLRLEKDMTQADLAKIFEVSTTTIASWEQGRSRPNIQEIAEIAIFFGVSVDYLLGLTEEKEPAMKYFFSVHELKSRGLVGEEAAAEDTDVIKFKNLMAEEDITAEFLEEIMPIIRELKKHFPKM